eukprot:3308412-Rhodomonas_salina.2
MVVALPACATALYQVFRRPPLRHSTPVSYRVQTGEGTKSVCHHRQSASVAPHIFKLTLGGPVWTSLMTSVNFCGETRLGGATDSQYKKIHRKICVGKRR